MDAFGPPADLDAVAALEEHLAVAWEYDVEVVNGAAIDEGARCVSRVIRRLESVDARTLV